MLFLIVLLLNFGLLIIIKSDNKYWLIPIPVWIIFISSFLIWRGIYDKKIELLDYKYWKSADYNKLIDESNWRGDDDLWKKLEETRKYVQKYNMTFLHSIFLQTVVTFLLQLVGYRTTGKRRLYKVTSNIFGILTFIHFIIEIMIGIVPTGGIIG
jgi:hypothetical protein